jgi:hypothetical protein
LTKTGKLKYNGKIRRFDEMVKIDRLWNMDDSDLEPRIEILYKRPRIDYRISEYVFDYINKNILNSNKIMQTGDYSICLSLDIYYRDDQKYFEDSTYNTKTEKYDSETSNITENGIKYKNIHLFCYSTQVNENLKPKEYANIVYDMIGAFLTKKYKKITKEIMDKNKSGMDYKIIEKFKYPASFKDQKYLMDDDEDVVVYCDIGEIKIKEEYIKYYGE